MSVSRIILLRVLILGVLIWMLDALIDTLFFCDGSFFEVLILDIPTEVFIHRTIITLLLIGFGIIISLCSTKQDRTEKELEETRRIAETLMNDLPGMAYRCKHNQKCSMLFISEGCEKITGYSIDELLDDRTVSYGSLINKEDTKKTYSEVVKKIETKAPFQVSYRIKTKSGEEKWVWEQGRGIYDDNGNVKFIEGFISDITAVKSAREKLKKSREEWARSFDSLNYPVFILENDWTISAVNRTAASAAKTERNELYGMNFLEALKIKDKCKIEMLPSEIHDENNNPYLEEIEMLDGTYLLSCTPIKNADGIFENFVIIAANITQRIEIEEQLRESEERYRTFYNNAPIGFYRISLPEGIIIDANDVLVKGLGYNDKNEVIGKVKTSDIDFNPDDRNYILKVLQEKGIIRNYETIVKSRDGQSIWVSFSSWLVKEKGYVEGIAANISAQKAAEEASRISEETYRNFFNNAQVGFLRLEAESTLLIEVNSRLALMFGYESRSQVIGKVKVKDLYKNPEDRAALLEILASNGVIQNYEVEFKKNDGDFIWVRTTAWMRDNNTIIEGIATDITKQKEAEKALEESESKYIALIDQLSDAVYLMVDGKFEIVNRKAIELFEVNPEEMSSQEFNFYDHVAPESRELIKNNMENLAKGILPPRDFDFKGMTKSGRIMDMQSSLSFVKVGNKTAVQGLIRDITEKKRLEAEFLHAQKMEVVGRLAGGVSHDFNNILTAIMGHCDLALLSTDANDPLRKDIDEIKFAAERASHLTRQLLAFSRKQRLNFKTVDLNSILAKMQSMLHRIIGEEISLESVLHADMCKIRADVSQIEQVIVNLIVNAKDAIENRGYIKVSTEIICIEAGHSLPYKTVKPSKYIQLNVEDSGKGMPKNILENVFVPFFTTKQQGEGTGLGLSTVYGIISQSGGWIEIDSEPGKGTKVKIYLPESNEEIAVLISEENKVNMPRGNESILVVEDENVVRSMTVRTLQRLGYKVTEARSGGDGVIICEKRERPFDLIISDVLMPNMNGTELEEILRQRWKDLKILYMSGYSEDLIFSKYLHPDKPFILKPFKANDLAYKVREIINGN